MANYTNLKNIIDQYITTNGQGDITGAILNNVLKSIVDSIGADFLFAGVAEPTTNPGSPDQNVFYIAIKGGTYTNFGNVVIPNGITIFMWNGSWSNQILFAGDGGVFDITAYNNNTKYADLTAALGTNGANVPQSLRKGGMSVKFVKSSDNKYVQYRLMSDSFNTTVANWQGVDEEPTAGSHNLVESGGVFDELNERILEPVSFDGVEDGKFIGDSGNIASAQSYKVHYISCQKGDEFVLSFNHDGPSSSGARAWAIYSAEDISTASSSTLIEKGENLMDVIQGTNYAITITNNTSKLLCVVELDFLVKVKPTLKKYGYENIKESLGKLDQRIVQVERDVEDVSNYLENTDENPQKDSSRLVKSGGVFESYNKLIIDSIPLENSLNGKFIGDTGNLGNAGTEYTIFYIPCAQGDTFRLTYSGDGPSSSVAKMYGVYSIDNIAEVTNAYLLQLGDTITQVVAGQEYEITISDESAKLLIIQQFVGGAVNMVPSMIGTVYKNRFNIIEEELQGEGLTKVPFTNDNFISESFIGSSGNIGPSNTFGIYKVDCKEGDTFKLFTFRKIGGDVARSYAIYSSDSAFNESTALEVGNISTEGEIEININYASAKKILIGWRTISDIELFRKEQKSEIELINEDLNNNKLDSIKVRFDYDHTLKTTTIRSEFDFSENPELPDYERGLNRLMFQIQDKMDDLAEANPDYITKYDAAELVGLSYPVYANGIETVGQYQITPRYRTYMYKMVYVNPGVNYKCNRPLKILITGSIHGDEQTASLNMYTIMKELCNDYLSDINLFKMRGAFEIYMVPCVNGYSSIHRARQNANGVNINRNFPVAEWSEYGSSDPSDLNYRGPYAGSEFETQLIMRLINSINPDMYIDAHSYAMWESLQFYTEMADPHNVRLAFDSIVDVSYTLKKAFPSWYGTQYSLLKGDSTHESRGHAPADADNYGGKTFVWAFRNGVKMALTIEVGGGINYNHGELDGHDVFIEEVYQIAEYTLRNQLMRYGEYTNNQLVSPLFYEE